MQSMNAFLNLIFITLFFFLVAFIFFSSHNANWEPNMVAMLNEDEKPKMENALASPDIADGLEKYLYIADRMLVITTNIDNDALRQTNVDKAYYLRLTQNDSNHKQPKGDHTIMLTVADSVGR